MIRAVIKYWITKGSTKASVVLRKDKIDKSDTRFAKKKVEKLQMRKWLWLQMLQAFSVIMNNFMPKMWKLK